MKIILLSIGTRGEMEPFLAIGEILKKKDIMSSVRSRNSLDILRKSHIWNLRLWEQNLLR